MSRFRFAALFLLCLVLPALAQEGVLFVNSPFRSLTRNRALLEAADLRVLLPLGYRQQSAAPGLLVMAGRQGVAESRLYARRVANRELRLELAIVAGVNGGYDFALYGEEGNPGSGAINRDLADVRRRFEDMLGRSRSTAPERTELGYEMYRLGHIEADRALALLKALGYSTIEFEQKGTASKTSDYEQIFNLVDSRERKLPLIIKVVNSAKTSLMQEDSGSRSRTSSSTRTSKGIEGAPELGGSHLHGATSGEPLERLLLVYDRSDPEALEKVVNLLQTLIDVPAQQIVIEALVIEVNTSDLQDLGVEFSGSRGNVSGRFERDKGVDLPFTFLFSRGSFADFIDFKGKVEALAETGNAKVLSSPSVLVLNDRQARIQVGQQIPVVRSTTTVSTTTSSVEYFPIGIVLNLRPRINREGTEVTMQIETIISSVSQSTPLSGSGTSQVAFAPIVDNRQVETYVRVANGTPFIIGGLLSTENQGRKVGLPLLSRIPLLGSLFSRERVEREGREVIVVLTPHIVPLDDHSFSYLIPKDSDLFDRFDTQLFRNAYRVRDDDVYDLKFIWRSPVLQNLVGKVQRHAQEDVMLQRQEPFRSLLSGVIPGEEVLVRRMIYEIVGKLKFDQLVDVEKIFFFTEPVDAAQSFRDMTLSEVLGPALEVPESMAVLIYDAQRIPMAGRAFRLPLAAVSDTSIEVRLQRRFLNQLNQFDSTGVAQQWGIALGAQRDVERLKRVLILKQVLDLNKDLAQSLQAFRPGVQVLFPTRDDMRSRYHLIDREVAQLFYETEFYYEAAERSFNRTVREVDALLGAGR